MGRARGVSAVGFSPTCQFRTLSPGLTSNLELRRSFDGGCISQPYRGLDSSQVLGRSRPAVRAHMQIVPHVDEASLFVVLRI